MILLTGHLSARVGHIFADGSFGSRVGNMFLLTGCVWTLRERNWFGQNWPTHTQMRDEKSLDKTPHLDKIWKATNFQEQLARLNRPTKSDAWQANFWPKSTNQVLASARTSLTNCTIILELFFFASFLCWLSFTKPRKLFYHEVICRLYNVA